MKLMSQSLLVIALTLLSAWGCAPWLQSCFGTRDAPGRVNWDVVQEHALLANTTYSEKEEITQRYPGSWVHDIPDLQSRIVLVTDESSQTHWLGIRGTANTKNALMDAEYLKERDPKLGIYLHKGFHRLAREAYEAFAPHLKPGYRLRVTGHSLGGAAAAILCMYYDVDQKDVTSCFTFGQPKVTNEEGVNRFWELPLKRFVDGEDIVPLVPPLTVASAIHGSYRHLGEEFILQSEGHFLWLDKHDANRVLISGTWASLFHESVKDHFMRNYLKRISAVVERVGEEKVRVASAPQAFTPE